MSARRVKGEGSIYQKCEARFGCPPVATITHPDGTTTRERPKHACKGRWFYEADLGWHGPAGAKKRDRRTVSAKTVKLLGPKVDKLKSEIGANLDADGKMPLDQWLKRWMTDIAPQTAKSQRTRDTYQGYIDNWINPNLGSKPLNRLRPSDLRALYKKMGDAGKTPATIHQVHAILTRALRVAEDDQLIMRSPAKPVTPPSGDKGSHGKLTTDEARKVMRVLATRKDRSRWYAALLLGLRQGEALGLAWDAIDLDRNVIHVRQSLGRVKGKGLVLGPVKSQASRRTLPLLAEIRTALDDVERSGELVWGPKDNKADYNVWQAILKEAGVPPRPLHAARASTASILSDYGVPAKIVAEILGHAQVTTTEAHYIHGDETIHRTALEGMTRELTQG